MQVPARLKRAQHRHFRQNRDRARG